MTGAESAKLILGGKWFLEPISLSLLIPYLITTSILAALTQLTSLGYEIANYWLFFGKLTLANCVAFLVCWILISLLNATFLRGKSQSGTPYLAIISISFAVGATKGLVTGFASIPLGIFPDFANAVGFKWVQTGILGVLLIPLLALVCHSLEQIASKHQLLLSEKVQGLLSKQTDFAEPNQLVTDFMNLASKRIDELEDRLKVEPERSTELIRGTILDLVDRHVRPLSRKIYREDARTRNPFSLSWSVDALYRNGIFGHLVSFLIIFLTIFMGYLQVSPLNQALAETSSIVAVIALLTVPMVVFRPKGLAVGISIFIFWTALAVVGGLVLGDLFVPRQNPTNLAALGFLIWVLVVQNLLFISVGRSTLKDNRALDAELQGVFHGTRLDVQARKIFREVASRNLAQYLHSDVQNRLLSTSLAADVSVAPSPQEAIQQLRSVIESIGQNLKPEDSLTWLTLEDKVKNQWEGFLEVSFSLEPGLEQWLEKPNSLLYETVSECVSNSLRHGSASRVLVHIQGSKTIPACLKVVVEDNGFGPRNGKPGLGTRLINSASRGNWKLEALAGGGSRLTCEIPLSSDSRPRQESNLRPRD